MSDPQNGRPPSNVWIHFVKKCEEKSKGHYSAQCKYCTKKFSCGQPQKLLSHLANHCPGCTHEIRKECLRQINDDNNNENLESSSTQQPISNFYESTLLTKERNDSINRALIKAFVCCGISFSVVSNPYFIDLLQQLRPAYQPPSKSILSGKFLDTEISNVNNKLNSILENNKNL